MIDIKPYTKNYYVDKTENLEVLTIPCRSDNYTYLVISPDKKKATLVDCADHEKTLKLLDDLNLDLKFILLTHHHFDHVDGLDKIITKHPNCEFYCTEEDQKRNVFSTKGTWVEDSDEIQIFGDTIKVIETPGHTTSLVSYHFEKSNALFCGDLIFSLGCGRVFEHYPDVFKDFYESIEKVKNATNDETLIFCAHEYTKTNLEFHNAKNILKDNTIKALQYRIDNFSGERSVPTIMGFEKEHNAFLNTENFKFFEAIRKLKDTF